MHARFVAGTFVAVAAIASAYLLLHRTEAATGFTEVPEAKFSFVRDVDGSGLQTVSALPTVTEAMATSPLQSLIDRTYNKAAFKCCIRVDGGISEGSDLGRYRVRLKSSQGSIDLKLKRVGDMIISNDFVLASDEGVSLMPGIQELRILKSIDKGIVVTLLEKRQNPVPRLIDVSD